MNLQQSDDELRLQMQQIAAAESDRGSRVSNPLAAVLGIGSIVLLVWLLFALAPIFGLLLSFAREAVDITVSLFGSIHSADRPHLASLGVVVSIGFRFTLCPSISACAVSIGREPNQRFVDRASEILE